MTIVDGNVHGQKKHSRCIGQDLCWTFMLKCRVQMNMFNSADPGMSMGRLLSASTEYIMKHLMHSDSELHVV